MGDPYHFPVALQWDLGPEKLKELKNKLLVYFQSKSKSNGGECVIRDPDCTPGYVLIHFSQETVRKQILGKRTHELSLSNGKRLKLDVRLPGAPPPAAGRPVPRVSWKPINLTPYKLPGPSTRGSSVPRAPRPPRALIQNVWGSYTREMLSLLVENVSAACERRDFYIEMIPEIGAAAVTFTRNIDPLNFTAQFCSSPRANQMGLTAQPMEETKAVRVENLPPSTRETDLVIYFESPQNGGGRAQKAELLPEEEAALLTFSEEGVVQTVLGKQHVFGKRPISVYPYYESLGITLYGEKGPCVTLPEPLEVPVSPYVLEFILGDPQIKGDIDKKMADKNCEITWPDPNCPNPTIKLSIPSSISSHLRTVAKIVRTWRDQVSTEFSLFISKFKDTEYDVIPPVWEAIKGEVSSSTYGGVLVKPDLAKHKVFIAGLLGDVDWIGETLSDLVENITRQVERQRQTLEEVEPVPQALYRLLLAEGLEKTVMGRYPQLKMSYDKLTKSLKICGLREEIDGAKCAIRDMKGTLNQKAVDLPSAVLQFLRLANTDELSCLLLSDHGIKAMFHMDNNTVTLIGCSMKDVTDAEERMRRELQWKEVIMDQLVAQSPEWADLKVHLDKTLNSERCTLVVNDLAPIGKPSVIVSGLAPSMQSAYRQVHEFVEKNSVLQKDIQVGRTFRPEVTMKYLKETKAQLCQKMKNVTVTIELQRQTISLQGPRLCVQEAETLVQTELASLCFDTLSSSKPGVKKLCKENAVMYSTTAMHQYGCVIHVQEGGPSAVEPSSPRYQGQIQDGVTTVDKSNPIHHKGDGLNVDVKLTTKEGLTVSVIQRNIQDATPSFELVWALVFLILNIHGKCLCHNLDVKCASCPPHSYRTSEDVSKGRGRFFMICVSYLTCNVALSFEQVVGLPQEEVISSVLIPTFSAFSASNMTNRHVIVHRHPLGIPPLVVFPACADIDGVPFHECVVEDGALRAEPRGDRGTEGHGREGHDSGLAPRGDIRFGSYRFIAAADKETIDYEYLYLASIFWFTSRPYSTCFSREFTRKHNNVGLSPAKICAPPAPAPGFYGAVTSPAPGVHEMKVGPVLYQVRPGDITKEPSDVIVSSSNQNFTLKLGVSKAILEAAGPSVDTECALSRAQPHKGFIVTRGGNLQCKWILHVVGSTDTTQIKSSVIEALKECGRLKAKSVAFPAIGTGVGAAPASAVADAMLGAVEDYVTSQPVQSLQEVKIIIFQQQVLNEFYTSMKRKEGSNPSAPKLLPGQIPSPMKSTKRPLKAKSVDFTETVEPVVFQLCGISKDSVTQASKWLQELILKEQSENVISWEWPEGFSVHEKRKLYDLQAKHQVTIKLEPQPSKTLIRINGLNSDVLKVSREVQAMMEKIKDKKTKEREAELCSTLVEWKYHNGVKFEAFNKITNMELEKNRNNVQQTVTVCIKGETFNVDFINKCVRNNQGKSLSIQRAPKGALPFPDYWDEMETVLYKEVPLDPAGKEYKQVEALVQRSCAVKILTITRIQNKHLWQNYQIRKQSIDAKNKQWVNEKQLFHGTQELTIKSINQNGFNRSYAGMNAASFGKGTYFAVDAAYSANDTYSKPGPNGQKYMYLARVLTGLSCLGNKAMISPPSRSASDPTDLYDSASNNPAAPNMFVIFNDVQAYPEYLISFTP
ncbi:protein mono-ADP-ribosyltransferase PARP14 [Xenopus tropicalis]|uniref:Poly [ADP-ribose] polymerase n=1 Tax=Xenopus tropicalis TaxID=8364 RepID=A0A8J1IYB3_XENTR|nr:protein mono-ADP-ribosyltransferase PARP14 [Xenopus tropicalis]